MNTAAAAQQKAIPARTLAIFAADVARAERALAECKHASTAARARMKSPVDEGAEPEAVAEVRKERDRWERALPDLARALETAREDQQAAEQRARRAQATKGFERIRDAVSEQAHRGAKLEDSIDAVGKALMEFRKGLDSTDEVMRSNGVMPDVYELRTLYAGIIDIRMFLATDGLLGRKRTLESKYEIEKAGHDSMRRVVGEWQALALQRARATLRVSG